jgi:hypothetical protein
LPFVLAVIAVALVFEVRPLRIATRWSRERMLLAVSVLATILLYEGGMLRADTTDMAGTLLAVPGLVVVVATVLPRLLGGRRRATLIGAPPGRRPSAMRRRSPPGGRRPGRW